MRGIDFDSPTWAAYILVACVMAFVLYIMYVTAQRPDPPVETIPPAVYVVETTGP